ncbi:TonB-dependent receptor [Dyella mobilis]|uniref:TonB-dependent receptor n=1 Tax=Dyella mobilis TaxID=1849582 RepID=A0ABS2KIM5_9GAMM|nr:TonB-dependent receptor [Dyella mobilis]MBM7130981.1 TonB-dependent receptor [Dyella mobilis]GLQ97610.1 TonB-dependent receptor [Dyella mobilis]
MNRSTRALYRCPPAYLALCLAMAIATPVSAQDATNNGGPAATGPSASGDTNDGTSSQNAKTLAGMQVTANSAVSTIAPTQGSTVATEPQSIIGSTFIQENIPPTGDYTDAIAISPSVYTIAPNGSGLMETSVASIRGFQDGQYNVTFDGIPWGDSNDFTHHSTSYFTNQDTSSVTVDRGPGTAGTLGDATFGGTVSVESINPTSQFNIRPYISFGSWETAVEGARIDTGSLNSSGTSAVVNVQNSSSDGYLTYAGQQRQNVFAKIVQPLGDNTTLTFGGMWNKIKQYVPFGATKEEIAEYGPNYGLNNDPTSQDYYRYTNDQITTYMGYVGLHSEFDGWTIDNKGYTYAYNHFGFNGLDPNGETPNGTFCNGKGNDCQDPNDVPAQHMRNWYRSWGDILRVSKELGPGELRTGMWFDDQDNLRWEYEFDDTLDEPAINTTGQPTKGSDSPVDRFMTDSLRTLQPFVEYQWNITDQAYLIGGVKYEDFQRNIDSLYNQKTGTPLDYSKEWNATLPSASFHYAFTSNWTAYAQWAKGFLAPNLNLFYVTNPSISDSALEPEKTTNIQLGTTWSSDRLSVSGDVYKIDFNNFIQSEKHGGNTYFYNGGGVHYKGVELEGTYMLGAGFSAYANGSLNRAIQTESNTWNPNTPHKTAAVGFIYSNGSIYASLMDKFVGKTYYTANSNDDTPIGGYAITNFTASWKFDPHITNVKDLKIGFQLNNLFNNTHINALAGTTAADGTPLFFTIPARNFNFTVSADLF